MPSWLAQESGGIRDQDGDNLADVHRCSEDQSPELFDLRVNEEPELVPGAVWSQLRSEVEHCGMKDFGAQI